MLSDRLRKAARFAAETESTPFYLLDIDAIAARARYVSGVWGRLFPKCQIAYSYKTNSLRAVTRTLARMGLAAEVVSEAELKYALEDGVTGGLFFGGPVATAAEIALAVDAGAVIEVDSLAQLSGLLKLSRSGPRARCILRMAIYRDNRWSRFGLVPDEYGPALEMMTDQNVELIGVHFHVGSNMTHPETHARVAEMYLPIVVDIHRWLRDRPVMLNIGGGFPARSCNEEGTTPDISEFACQVHSILESRFNLAELELVLEPGRTVVEDNAVLVSRVIVQKKRGSQSLLFLDAGSNSIPSVSRWYHDVELQQGEGDRGRRVHDLYGCLCFESDLIARGVVGPELVEAGTLVLVGQVGGYDIATANYWVHSSPEVLAFASGRVRQLRGSCSPSELRGNEIDAG